MSLDESLIAYAVRYEGGFSGLQRAGITPDYFVDEFRTVWNYLARTKRQHDRVPSEDTLLARFPDLSLPRVRRRDVPILLNDIRQRNKFIRLLKSINQVADSATSYDVVDDVIMQLQGSINEIAFSGEKAHIVDIFSEDAKKRMLKDFRKRKAGSIIGIPTGLRRFDATLGGLQKQRMYTAIGRPGIGKSWLDLLFVKSAVLAGHKVVLYPLEMTLEETAFRLYTLFSSSLFGVQRAVKNYDLTMGAVPTRKLVRLLNTLQDKFTGQLLIADIGSLSDPYTTERVEAEAELYRPDMVWVDYITLMKAPGDDDGWQSVGRLSKGMKNCAVRRKVVSGCSAQVNREAMKNPNVFLPRLENISYGDAIGQDTDGCFSLNRKVINGHVYLYYAMVKNRGGPEIGQTRMRFDVNVGDIEETQEAEEED